MKQLAIFLALALAIFFSSPAQGASFALGLEGCPEKGLGVPGEEKSFDVFATLTTTGNDSPAGAAGWSFVIIADGGEFKQVALEGIVVTAIYDEDGNPATPPVDPYGFDLGDAGSQFVQLRPSDPGQGIFDVALVSLILPENMTLQPEGTQRIAKITVKGKIPADQPCASLTLRYSSLSGQPVENLVSFGGVDVTPELGSCEVLLCQPEPGAALSLVPPGQYPPAQGDGVYDIMVPAGEALSVPVDVVLSTWNLPGPYGAQSWSLSILNEPCMTVKEFTIKGLEVGAVIDDDGDPATPPVDRLVFLTEIIGFFNASKATGGDPSPLPEDAQGVVGVIPLQDRYPILSPNTSNPILRIVYSIPPGTDNEILECRVSFVDGLRGADQPVRNTITYDGKTSVPTETHGLVLRVQFLDESGLFHLYIRGDANDDGRSDIADPIFLMNYLFTGTEPDLQCPVMGDANDDGAVDISDAISLLDYQFLGGPRPPEPFPICGTVPVCPGSSRFCVGGP